MRSNCKNARERALLEFFRCTACRVAGVLRIYINDIDFRTGKLQVYGSKTRKYRLVMVDKICIKYLKEYIYQRGLNEYSNAYLFTRSKGDLSQPLSTDGIRLALCNIRQRADMNRRVYPHLFRKTTATEIVRKSGSDEMTSAYLGHKPKTVTGMFYTYL